MKDIETETNSYLTLIDQIVTSGRFTEIDAAFFGSQTGLMRLYIAYQRMRRKRQRRKRKEPRTQRRKGKAPEVEIESLKG